MCLILAWDYSKHHQHYLHWPHSHLIWSSCFRKVPSSPRCPSVSSVGILPTTHGAGAGLVGVASMGVAGPVAPPVPCSSPKPVGVARVRQPSLTSQMAARALNTSQYSEPCTSLSPLCHESPSLPIKVKTWVYINLLLIDHFIMLSCWYCFSKAFWNLYKEIEFSLVKVISFKFPSIKQIIETSFRQGLHLPPSLHPYCYSLRLWCLESGSKEMHRSQSNQTTIQTSAWCSEVANELKTFSYHLIDAWSHKMRNALTSLETWLMLLMNYAWMILDLKFFKLAFWMN